MRHSGLALLDRPPGQATPVLALSASEHAGRAVATDTRARLLNPPPRTGSVQTASSIARARRFYSPLFPLPVLVF
ncbi:hypothetical protein V5799_000375 [Amblyomma americanum]|uniref:Uncharacterized protein n=1 Tax=Amblyomma americanum TaxID=6943 RepID=A0AAQ4D381_AMBAM